MISYKDLGTIILFLLGIGIGIYLIMILIQVKAIVKSVREFLDLSRPVLDETMETLPIIASKVDDAANDLKYGIGKSSDALESIGETLTETVSSVATGAKEVIGYLGIISEVIKIIIKTLKK